MNDVLRQKAKSHRLSNRNMDFVRRFETLFGILNLPPPLATHDINHESLFHEQLVMGLHRIDIHAKHGHQDQSCKAYPPGEYKAVPPIGVFQFVVEIVAMLRPSQ